MQTNKPNLVVLGAAESGIGAALLGVQQGWSVFVSDSGKIKSQYKEVLDNNGIKYEEDGHTKSRIFEASCIVKSPGISEKVEIIKEIRKAGIEVCSEIEFGYRYKGDSKIVAITGSNGKSTTTQLIYEIAVEAGLNVALVGNIGYSFARRVAENKADWYIMEISSFQLDDIHFFKPNVAILLNITPDHLDRYNYSFENYIKSKFRITENQTNNDYFIINKDDTAITKYLTDNLTKAKTIYFTMNEDIKLLEGGYITNENMFIYANNEIFEMSVNDLALKGKHNQYNCMAAGIASGIMMVRNKSVRDILSKFQGLNHRLEFIANVKGITFINDSKATNLNSVWYALECMKQPVILIMGGQDKGNDYSEILELVKQKVKLIVCLTTNCTPIHKAFGGIIDIIDTLNMNDAVNAAYAFAEKGDAVLLSPACASFDLFQNYEDRGNKFKEAVNNL